MLKPVFLISISGIVSHCKPEVTSSTTNEAMKEFRLQDQSGRYVNCKAYGRHAVNSIIEDSTEVVLYFALARSGLNNQTGSLWLFDDAHVLELSKSRSVPPCRQLVELRV